MPKANTPSTEGAEVFPPDLDEVLATLDSNKLLGYSSTEVYILDGGGNKRITVVSDGGDPQAPRSERNSGSHLLSQHAQKVDLMANLFARTFDAKVMKVNFTKKDRAGSVVEFFRKQFKQDNNTNFKVVYFHGKAGNNGEEYTWKFKGPNSMTSNINAFRVIESIVDSGVDCLIVCDCYVPNRFQNKWRPGDGTVTILGRGEEAKDEEDDIINGHDFTESIIERLNSIMKRGCHTRKKPFSLNQLLGTPRPSGLTKVTRLYDNPKVVPIRAYVPLSKRGGASRVQLGTRGVMVPQHIEATGKITFFRKVIQKEEQLIRREPEAVSDTNAVMETAEKEEATLIPGAECESPILVMDEDNDEDEGFAEQ